MTSQAHVRIPFNEPSVVVNIAQTEVEPEVYRLPYPPELTLKRRVSESFLQTRGFLKKQRESFGRNHKTTIDCPCLPPPTYDVTMTEPAWNLDSVYSTLPTTPPTLDIQDSESHARRPSQVAEIMEKVNTRLRRLFGSRRGSTGDETPPLNRTFTQRSSISDIISGPMEDLYIHRVSKDLAEKGLAALPNVSKYLDVNGEVGPSRFYNTTDWDDFQATLRAQRRNTIQAQLNTDLYYDGDGDLEQLKSLRQHDTRTERCGERERKDSQFSFSDFLKPRRSSKVDKGKGRMVYDDETGSVTQDQPLLSPYQDDSLDAVQPSTMQTNFPLFAPSDNDQILVSEEPVASSSYIASSAPVSPTDYSIPQRPDPTTREASECPVPPTPCRPRSKRRSSISSTTSNASVSISTSATPVNRPSTTLRRLAQAIINTPAKIPNEADATSHSKPISIPSLHSDTHRSSTAPVPSARPSNDSPALPSSFTSSSPSSSSPTNLLSHTHHPNPTPTPSSLHPTLIPSPETIQTLHLGPPQRALLQRSPSSESRIFHISVEHLGTTTTTTTTTATPPTQHISISPLDETPRTTIANKADWPRRDERDEPDFSITHAAPPNPLANVPLSLVKRRRAGGREESGGLRAVYIEQGRASVVNCPARQRSPRKSLQGRLWWDESPPRVYL